MGLVDRLQNWIAYAEGMARCLPERRDDKAVCPPDDKRRLVRRVRSKTTFDPARLHQDCKAAPIDGPEFLRQDEEGVTDHLSLLIQQPEAVTIEVRFCRPRKMQVETQGIRGEDLGLRRDADRQVRRSRIRISEPSKLKPAVTPTACGGSRRPGSPSLPRSCPAVRASGRPSGSPASGRRYLHIGSARRRSGH